MKTLKDLKTGEKGIIKKIKSSGPIHRRLMDMGFVSGVSVEMIKPAPLGDPVEFKLKGYHLSLRKSEAEFIEIAEF